HLPTNARVLYGPATTLYIDRDVEGWTLDALSPVAGRAATVQFFQRVRPTFAAVLSTDLQRLRQLRFVKARPVARVIVHQVFSRTRDIVGPPETLDVFVVPRVAS